MLTSGTAAAAAEVQLQMCADSTGSPVGRRVESHAPNTSLSHLYFKHGAAELSDRVL